jgi:hypothetical protein
MAKKKSGKSRFNFGDFKYLDELGLTMPQLVLGIEIPGSCFDDEPGWSCHQYDLKSDRNWVKIAHQTAGLACHQHWMIGTFLKPKSVELLQNMQKLSDKWLDSNAGVFGLSLAEANEYDGDLKYLFGVGCNRSWKDMEEAFYPIDCTPENIAAMTDEVLPNDLDELIEWGSGWERAIGCVNRWRLFVLGLNSD